MSQSTFEIIEIDAPVAPEFRPVMTLCAAEVAECTCPEWCERDHDID